MHHKWMTGTSPGSPLTGPTSDHAAANASAFAKRTHSLQKEPEVTELKPVSFMNASDTLSLHVRYVSDVDLRETLQNIYEDC